MTEAERNLLKKLARLMLVDSERNGFYGDAREIRQWLDVMATVEETK